MRARKDRYLFISDLQIPFQALRALKFVLAIQREFAVPNENIYNVGDEVDQYFGSRFVKDPDSYYTPNSEIKATVDAVKEWGAALPKMKIAISNHGVRWAKKAFEAEIPSQMIRPYQELLGAPKGWVWQPEWIIEGSRKRFRMIHGMGYSGMNGHRTAALDAGMSTIIGHLHSHSGISYIKTSGQFIWGMNVGSLIDETAFAFNYGKDSRFKSVLTIGVVVDGGLTPILIPYERF